MSCPDCKKGNLLPGEPKGTLAADGSYYLAAAPPSDVPSKRAVVLLTDAFGLPLKNSKIIADNLAARLACDVWVPDLFAGRPLLAVNQLSLPDRPGEKSSFLDKLRLIFAILPSIPAFIASRGSVVDSRLASFFSKTLADKKYESIGAVGYCFGGSVAVRLASTGLIKSVVICHPGGQTDALVQAIKVPSSWACAEEDMSFNAANRAKAEAVLAGRKGKPEFTEYEFKDYKGTVHGFAARPNLSIPEAKEGYEKSFEQTVDWFNKTLPV